jgi:hypothetical protein
MIDRTIITIINTIITGLTDSENKYIGTLLYETIPNGGNTTPCSSVFYPKIVDLKNLYGKSALFFIILAVYVFSPVLTILNISIVIV